MNKKLKRFSIFFRALCISSILMGGLNICMAYNEIDPTYWYDGLMFDDPNSNALLRKFNMGENPSVSIMDISWFLDSYSRYDGQTIFPKSVLYEGVDYDVVATENYCFYKLLQGNGDELRLPSGLRYLGSKNFYDCSLTRLELPNELEVISSNSFSNGGIDEIILGNDLNRIDNSCFSSFYISSITFNSALRYIGSNSFVNIEGLTEIILPESLKKIVSGCFRNIKSLEHVYLPKGISNFELNNCFNGCPNLKQIDCAATLPPVLVNSFADVNKNECIIRVPIGSKEAYLSSESWKDFKIEEADIEIAIPDTQETAELTIGNRVYSVRTAGDGSIYAIIDDSVMIETEGQSSEEEFTIPEKLTIGAKEYEVTAIGSSVITDLKATRAKLPEDLFRIDGGNFNNFTELEQLSFGTELAYIGANCFNGLSSLETLELPKYLHSIERNCFNDGRWESVEFPETLTYIDNNCFRDNSNLKTVALNANILSIGKNLFNGCQNLQTVRLSMPNSATYDEAIEECFNECPSITEIYFENPYVRLVNSFNDVDKSLCVLYVPEGTLETFKSLYPEFQNIQEFKSDKWGNDDSGVAEITFEDDSYIEYYDVLGTRLNNINLLKKGEIYIKKTSTGTSKNIKAN